MMRRSAALGRSGSEKAAFWIVDPANGSTRMASGGTPAAIRVEPFAGSTIQNAAFSLPLLPNAAERIIIVSDGFHLPRAWVIFRALGPQEVILHATTDAPFGQIFRWIRRESVAIWFNLWRAALYWGGGVLGIDRDTRIAWFD